VAKYALLLAFAVGAAFDHVATPVLKAQFRSMNTTRLLTTDLGSWCEGKELTVELNEAGPGSSGKHYHPAHSVTWVIDGSEVYAKEGAQGTTVHARELLHEAPFERHTVENVSPVKLLVVRIAEKGQPATFRVP